MADEVDICKLALSHIADEAEIDSIDPPDGSTQAGHCATFYPIARDQFFEEVKPNFAKKREVLGLQGTAPTGWLYRYKAPSDMIVDLEVYENGTDQAVDYEIESGEGIDDDVFILTDAENAELKFIARITDTTKYTTYTVTGISWLLAHYLAGPVTKKPKLAKSTLETYETVYLGKAKVSNMNSRRSKDAGYLPRAIAARKG